MHPKHKNFCYWLKMMIMIGLWSISYDVLVYVFPCWIFQDIRIASSSCLWPRTGEKKQKFAWWYFMKIKKPPGNRTATKGSRTDPFLVKCKYSPRGECQTPMQLHQRSNRNQPQLLFLRTSNSFLVIFTRCARWIFIEELWKIVQSYFTPQTYFLIHRSPWIFDEWLLYIFRQILHYSDR